MPQPPDIQESPSYEAIVNALPDMIIRIGKNSVFKGFEANVTGLDWPVGDYIGKPVDAVLPKAAANHFLKAIEKTFLTGKVQQLEVKLPIDGQAGYYDIRLTRCCEAEVIALVRDVTRERRDEQALDQHRSLLTQKITEAESKYQEIFHYSGAPSIIIEQDRTISMANQRFAEFIGYPRGDIEHRMKWTDFVHPKDRELATRYHFARRSGANDAPKEYECRFVDRTGKIKSIIAKVGILKDPGQTVISINDITSLKHKGKQIRDRETLYSAILEGYEGFIYTIDKNYRIRFLNETLIRDLGRDVNGEICYEAIHNRQSKCRWCVADEVFAGRTVRFQMKNPRNKKWYYSINVPVTLSDNARFCQAMIMDIDESKQMEETLRSSEAHLLEENSRLRSRVEDRHGFGDIVGKSALMQEVYELFLLAASSDNNVIIYGESGTGKELAAKTIHDMSGRSNGRFVPINCGAIPENLLESEFFGYTKGAFTGANTDKTGLLDEADQGSLFLDEIGEIETGFQVKLLRAIEGGGFTPVGGSGLHQPDFRIIAATNRNLTEKVKSGEMRSDFFYRVHVIPIYLPPLRKRKDDIPLLMEHFLKAYDRKIRPRITSKIMDTLMDYDWPGNVRELQNVLYRFVTLKRLDLTGAAPAVEGDGTDPVLGAEIFEDDVSLADAVANFETQFISSALAQHRWNRTQTAKHLGVGLRTLQRKIKQLGIQ